MVWNVVQLVPMRSIRARAITTRDRMTDFSRA